MYGSKGWLDMLQWSGTAVWAVVVGSKIRRSHWHGIRSKLHGLVDNLRIVCMLYLGGKLVICGRNLLNMSFEEDGTSVINYLQAIR